MRISNTQICEVSHKRTNEEMEQLSSSSDSLYQVSEMPSQEVVDNSLSNGMTQALACDVKAPHLDDVKKIRAKTPKEVAFLEAQFAKDPTWSRRTVQVCKRELKNLRTDQIYKWGYDKKLLLKKRSKGKTQAEVKRDLVREVRKEIFCSTDLNTFISGLVSNCETEMQLKPLYDLTKFINQDSSSQSNLPKNLNLECDLREEKKDYVSESLPKSSSDQYITPFAPVHKSFSSLFKFEKELLPYGEDVSTQSMFGVSESPQDYPSSLEKEQGTSFNSSEKPQSE
jgi:hypothetical protein